MFRMVSLSLLKTFYPEVTYRLNYYLQYCLRPLTVIYIVTLSIISLNGNVLLTPCNHILVFFNNKDLPCRVPEQLIYFSYIKNVKSLVYNGTMVRLTAYVNFA